MTTPLARPDFGQPGPGYQPPKFSAPNSAITYTLSRPIEGTRGPISELVFRRPTFGDWVEVGEFETNEFVFDETTSEKRFSVRVSPEAVAAWFTRLTGQPSSVLSQMSFADGRGCYGVLKQLMTDLESLGNRPASPGNSGASAA